MQIYRIKGWFKQGLFKQVFTRDVVSPSKERALERVYSEVGSRHNLTRNLIHIVDVAEVKPEEVTDPRVLATMS